MPYNRANATQRPAPPLGGLVVISGTQGADRHRVSDANRQIVDAWLEWLSVARNRSDNTIRNYRSATDSWLAWLGEVPLASVDTATAEAWLVRDRGGRIGSPATRARDVAVLRSLGRWMVNRGLCAHNVGAMIDAPTVHNVNPKPITDAMWLAAWAASDDRQRLAIGLMFWFGLRRYEVASLRGVHIDPSRQQLVGFPRKGGGDDVFPYGEVAQVWQALAPGIWDDHMLVLLQNATRTAQKPVCGPGTPDGLGRAIGALAGRVGATWTPHQLRHSFVTNMLRVGVPIEHVSRLANHSSVTVTMRYAKLGGGELRGWLEAEKMRRAARPDQVYGVRQGQAEGDGS